MHHAHVPLRRRRISNLITVLAMIGLLVGLFQLTTPAEATSVSSYIAAAAAPSSPASAAANLDGPADGDAQAETQPAANAAAPSLAEATADIIATADEDATTAIPTESEAQEPTVLPAQLPAPLDPCTELYSAPATVDATGATSTIGSNGDYSGAYPAWHAFDNDPSTLWLSETWQAPALLSNRVSRVSEVMTAYTLTFANGPNLTTRAPKVWHVQGSNDGGNTWTIVDTRVNETDWNGSETRQYNIATPGPFSSYRLAIKEDNDARSTIVVASIADFTLYDGCTFADPVVLDPYVNVFLTATDDGDCPNDYATIDPETAGEFDIAVGENLSYCFNLINSGEGTAQNVVVEHPAVAGGQFIVGELVPGAQYATQTTLANVGVSAAETTRAVVSSTNSDGEPQPTVTDSITVTVSGELYPDLLMRVSAITADTMCPTDFADASDAGDVTVYNLGDHAVFCFNIFNDGDSVAVNPVLTHYALPNGELALPDIAPGNQVVANAIALNLDATFPLVTIAEVTAQTSTGDVAPSVSAEIVIQVEYPQFADLALRTTPLTAGATCPQTYADAGDFDNMLTTGPDKDPWFCFNIKNTGPGIAYDVLLNHVALAAGDQYLGTLLPGEEAAVGVQVFDLPATFPPISTATVTSTNALGAPHPDAVSDFLLTWGVINPNIELVATATLADATCPATVADAAVAAPLTLTTSPADVQFCFNLKNTSSTASSITLEHESLADGQVVLGPLGQGEETLVASTVFGLVDFPTTTTVAATPSNVVFEIQPVVTTTVTFDYDFPLPSCADVSPLSLDPTQAFSSGDYSANYPPSHAFDGPTSTMWISEVWQDPAFVGISLPASPATVTAYQVRFANGPSLTTRAPNTWSLEGTHDGVNWIIVDKQYNQTDWASSETRSFDVAEPASFSRYRLVFLSDNDDRAPIVVISIADLSFYESCELSP